MGERIKVVCPTCDGSGWSAQGSTPAGGSCSSCRGEGEVWPERRERLTAAEAQVARVRALLKNPTWHRGMYGCPDDMIAARDLRRALDGEVTP